MHSLIWIAATLAVPALLQEKGMSATAEVTNVAVAADSLTVKSKDGAEISYDKTGTGPVLIVIAGASNFRTTSPTFAELARTLSDQFTVINYDRRGRGKSGDGIRGDRILWADESVGRVSALLDELKLADNTLLIFTSDNGPSDNLRMPGSNSITVARSPE